MTAPGEWIHIADHAWERYGIGAQYTVHADEQRWVVRGFSLSCVDTPLKEVEESVDTIDDAKALVEQWESQHRLSCGDWH